MIVVKSHSPTIVLALGVCCVMGCLEDSSDADETAETSSEPGADSLTSQELYATWELGAEEQAFDHDETSVIAAQASVPSTNVSAIQVSFAKQICAGMNGGSKTSGAPLQLAGCNNKAEQTFTFSRTPNGLYTIGTNQGTALCLEYDLDNETKGNAVVQRPCNGGSTAQQWLISANGVPNFYIRTRDGKASLSLAASQPTTQAPATGFKLITRAAAGIAQQSFTLPGFRVKSIRSYAKCDGVTDDRDAVNRALTEARGFAFVLLVDCPVRIKTGDDVNRPLFIYSGTTFNFNSQGKFIVDNAGIPAFVMANVSNISLLNANVQYVGGVSYEYSKSKAGIFNDTVLKTWLAENPKVKWSTWNGPTELSSIFYSQGPVGNIVVRNLKAYVPDHVGGDKLIPMVFAFSYGAVNNASVGGTTPATPQYVGIAKNIEFENIILDGTMMGITGHVQNATFRNITSYRYGDVQDPQGGHIGGTLAAAGPWFSPPHLFYLNYNSSADPGLFTRNVRISNVIDYGQRVTVTPRIEGGYNNSLKIGGDDVIVDGYQSYRPDGFVQIYISNNLTIRNVSGTFDSSYLQNRYSPGVLFSGGAGSSIKAYTNITVQNVNLKDLAPNPIKAPISTIKIAGNNNIQFSNMIFNMGTWLGDQSPLLTVFAANNIYGTNIHGKATYNLRDAQGKAVTLQASR